MSWIDRVFRREPIPDSGTLTFLHDGRIILGTPAKAGDAARAHAVDQLREWIDAGEPGRVLVFPWPLEVRDLRQ